tara:strand:+ start:731 stop:1528 length:798 start_codon:yes stop_codon:yes gene_type:complete
MADENIKLEIKPIESTIHVPKLIFIIPYRDREQHKHFFMRQMKYVLEDIKKEDYEIYFAHQCDSRDFNRGGMKNIGFIAMREKYPNDYKKITFVFNDVDTMPYTKNFLDYDTTHGNVKHFYGFNYTLGGIVSIKGDDYEKTNGFPNLWAWGFEDNMFNDRAIARGLHIDRSVFYPIMDKNILQLNDGLIRLVNRQEFDYVKMKTSDGINTITDIKYELDEDNNYINITGFNSLTEPNIKNNRLHDLRQGNSSIFGRKRGKMSMLL